MKQCPDLALSPFRSPYSTIEDHPHFLSCILRFSIIRLSSSRSRYYSACSSALICASCLSTIILRNYSRLRAPQHHAIPQQTTSNTNSPSRMPPPVW